VTAIMQEDVVDVLISQHGQVRDLFGVVASSTGDARRDAFERLVRLLAVHETAEEQVVHPLTRGSVHGGDEIADQRLAEENRAKEMLADLEKLGTDHAEFPEMLEEFRESVLTHAQHEEAYEFRYLRREVDPARLRSLAAVLKAAEAVAPTHPHPGVESATANLTIGPIAALIDRTKDLLKEAISRSR
jgi:hemerythrin superfamily protein